MHLSHLREGCDVLLKAHSTVDIGKVAVVVDMQPRQTAPCASSATQEEIGEASRALTVPCKTMCLPRPRLRVFVGRCRKTVKFSCKMTSLLIRAHLSEARSLRLPSNPAGERVTSFYYPKIDSIHYSRRE